MYINKIVCSQCNGKGHETVWKLKEQDVQNGVGTAIAEESICGNCGGTGIIRYPVFTLDESITIAKHFGFEVVES